LLSACINDVIGRIADKGGWEIVNLPLVATQDESFQRGPNLIYERKAGEYLHPARINKTLAQQLRDELGNSAFQAQYQQNPLPAGAGFFDLELIKRFESAPKAFEHIFFSVDVATVADGGDYSVCTIWGYVAQNFYLLDVWRKQVSFPELRKALVELDNKWLPSLIIVEAVGSGEALCQILSSELGRYVIPCCPKQSKAYRFEAATLVMERERVWMPTSAPWLETLIKELQAFPQGKHDDQVDSLSQMLFRWRDVVKRTRTICNARARRAIPTNYDVFAMRINCYDIPTGGMPDPW
jgi:predicted phage terminase large subunit-like protein